jgi:hypothetical protein
VRRDITVEASTSTRWLALSSTTILHHLLHPALLHRTISSSIRSTDMRSNHLNLNISSLSVVVLLLEVAEAALKVFTTFLTILNNLMQASMDPFKVKAHLRTKVLPKVKVRQMDILDQMVSRIRMVPT